MMGPDSLAGLALLGVIAGVWLAIALETCALVRWAGWRALEWAIGKVYYSRLGHYVRFRKRSGT
jgi:hypothetical protein